MLPGVPLSLTATVPLAPLVVPVIAGGALERVVRQHQDVDRRVLVGGGRVVGDVGDRIDRDVDGRGLGHAARGHRVGEAVGAVEVGVGRVDDEVVGRVAGRAVVVDRDGAVGAVGGRR